MEEDVLLLPQVAAVAVVLCRRLTVAPEEVTLTPALFDVPCPLVFTKIVLLSNTNDSPSSVND